MSGTEALTTLTKQNYVLVDFENVHVLELERIRGLPVKVIIFAGQQKKHVPMGLFRTACTLPNQVEVFESCASGRNALDSQIACFAGQLAEREPKAFIHILSRDKGFDSVVEFLKTQKRFCARADSFDDLRFFTALRLNGSPSGEDRMTFVIKRLQGMPANNRPGKKKKLHSAIHAMFQKQLEATAVEQLVLQLTASGKLSCGNNDAVTYTL